MLYTSAELTTKTVSPIPRFNHKQMKVKQIRTFKSSRIVKLQESFAVRNVILTSLFSSCADFRRFEKASARFRAASRSLFPSLSSSYRAAIILIPLVRSCRFADLVAIRQKLTFFRYSNDNKAHESPTRLSPATATTP